MGYCKVFLFVYVNESLYVSVVDQVEAHFRVVAVRKDLLQPKS